MLFRFLYLVFCGLFLGSAALSPGFSGSVLAIAMGIYQDLVSIASNPLRNLKQNIIFLAPLGIGTLAGALLFISASKFLFVTHEKVSYLFFAGLIAGNLPIVFSKVKAYGFRRGYLFAGAVPFAFTLALACGTLNIESTANIMCLGIPAMAVIGFGCGAITFVPGLSFSTIMTAVGVYGQLMIEAKSLLGGEIMFLAHFGALAVFFIVGLALAAKIIKITFDKFPGCAHSMVFGFMAGSLVGILLQGLLRTSDNFVWPAGVFMMFLGFGISVMFVFLKRVIDGK